MFKNIVDKNEKIQQYSVIVTDNPNWKVKMFDKPIEIITHPKVQYDVMELKKMQEMGMGKS